MGKNINGNKIKHDLLGEPIGTASAKLRKAILFKLVQSAGLAVCFHCKEKINDISNFSIEHKEAWQSSENPTESFYDLENIAFSHLKCNITAANRHVSHPTQGGEKHKDAKPTNEMVSNININIIVVI